MTPEEKIDGALARIESLIVEQCVHGSQSGELGNDGLACGQFIGPKAKNLPQRGLHGTAGALRVLAEGTSNDARTAVPRLIWYVQNREMLHGQGKEPERGNHTFDDDEKNVIKLSEILYALSFVKAGQASTDSLVSTLAGKLRSSRKEGKGWAHFTTGDNAIDHLPTAFAVLALSRHGFGADIAQQIEFLKSALFCSKSQKTGTISEVSVRILSLFSLTFRADELPQQEIGDLRRIFTELWRAHERLFNEDVEQNIEYSIGARNYYVRIPWQLYMLALAARLHPRTMSSLLARRTLDRIVDKAKSTGFTYPHSGDIPSARTNAILFDVLQKIKRFDRRGLLHSIYLASDAVRSFFSRPLFSWSVLGVGCVAVIYCIYAWFSAGPTSRDLGPEFTGAVIALILSFFYDRVKKK